jgi:aminopeptidase N
MEREDIGMTNRAFAASFLFILLVLSGAVAQPDTEFPCPYSGPVDDPVLRFHVEHYLIDVAIAYPTETTDGSISGSADIDCIALADPLDEVRFDLVNDPVSEVSSVFLNGSPAQFQFTGNEVQIPLLPPISSGSSFQIQIEYSVAGASHISFRPIDTPRFAFNTMVENSRWFPCLHDPRDKAAYTFHFRVAQGKSVAANGIKTSEVDNGDGTVTFTWEENDPMASYLATFNVADYVFFGHDYHGIPIQYYVVPEKLDAAQIDFENDDSILDFYVSAFGPYPFEKFGMAQILLSGAMENQDMISYGGSLITGDKRYEDIFAHETSHMWWGDSVTLNGCEDVWLNEGFASYCEALWEEHFYGQDQYDAVMSDFRERYFSEDATHRYSIYDPEVVWGRTTYQKAAWVLHMLRWVVGDDAFWSILPEYYDRYQYSNATTSDFQAVCEEFYGASLDWFFQEWIYDKGFPEFEFAWQYVGQSGSHLKIWVNQVQTNAPAVFRMPVEIHWTNSNQTSDSQIILLSSEADIFSLESSGEPVSVAFDPDENLLKKLTNVEPPVETGVDIWMPSHMFHPGDPCSCTAVVTNAGDSPVTGAVLFVILDVYGSYFFAPSFTNYDNYQDVYTDFQVGETDVAVIGNFTWPEVAGSADGLVWYGALTDSSVAHIIGKLGMWTFGYNG